jgi:hypothetical protein
MATTPAVGTTNTQNSVTVTTSTTKRPLPGDINEASIGKILITLITEGILTEGYRKS